MSELKNSTLITPDMVSDCEMIDVYNEEIKQTVDESAQHALKRMNKWQTRRQKFLNSFIDRFMEEIKLTFSNIGHCGSGSVLTLNYDDINKCLLMPINNEVLFKFHVKKWPCYYHCVFHQPFTNRDVLYVNECIKASFEESELYKIINNGENHFVIKLLCNK